MGCGASAGEYELCDAHLLCQFAERLTLHQFGACVGEESFGFSGKILVHYVAHDGIEYGISEELQSLVVELPAEFLPFAFVETSAVARCAVALSRVFVSAAFGCASVAFERFQFFGGGAVSHALVHEGELVVCYFVWIETEDVV